MRGEPAGSAEFVDLNPESAGALTAQAQLGIGPATGLQRTDDPSMATMEQQHHAMMRRRLDAGEGTFVESPGAIPAAGSEDEGMDIDWITIAEDQMPVKLIRGRSPCLSTLDFAASTCEGEAWDFSDDSHVHLAWQAIRHN